MSVRPSYPSTVSRADPPEGAAAKIVEEGRRGAGEGRACLSWSTAMIWLRSQGSSGSAEAACRHARSPETAGCCAGERYRPPASSRSTATLPSRQTPTTSPRLSRRSRLGTTAFAPLMLMAPSTAKAETSADSSETTAAILRFTMAPVHLAGRATQLASGVFHYCAILEDKTLWCWGANSLGQVGVGNTVDQLRPAQVRFPG